MNILNAAAQVSWPLQAVIAITFAVPLIGLAWQLRRPAATALAMSCVYTALAMTVISANAFFGAPLDQRPAPLLLALVLGMIGSFIPTLIAAIDALGTERRPSTFAALMRRSAMWGGLYFVAMLLVGLLEPHDGTSRPMFSLSLSRVVLIASYGWVAWHALRGCGRVPQHFRQPLKIFTVVLFLQLLRPLATVALFAGAPSSSLSEPRAIAFILFSAFLTTAFGVACILIALAEERAAVIDNNRRLQAATISIERAHRMESVGRLATGVAHDFNNFLTIIKSGAALACDRISDGEVPDEELLAIDDAADRGAALTRQLLTFARRQPQQIMLFDVVHRVQQMAPLLERIVGRQTSLTLTLPTTAMWINMDPTQFEQVLINLVTNAQKALTGDAGRITVQLAPKVVVNALPGNAGALADGAYLMLSVADTGCGMSPEIMQHIFEPFFTTRQDDGGSGLGLATVYGIAQQAGGDVSVESTVGVGTTLRVMIPTHAPAA